MIITSKFTSYSFVSRPMLSLLSHSVDWCIINRWNNFAVLFFLPLFVVDFFFFFFFMFVFMSIQSNLQWEVWKLELSWSNDSCCSLTYASCSSSLEHLERFFWFLEARRVHSFGRFILVISREKPTKKINRFLFIEHLETSYLRWTTRKII